MNRLPRACALATLTCLCVAAWSQAAHKTIFVTNNVSGNVTSFRIMPNGSLVSNGIFAAGTNPQDCALSADGRNLVVVNATAQSIEEVYTFVVNADGTLTRSEPPVLVGDGPLSIALSRSGFALVPSATDDNLSSFELLNDNLVLRSVAGAGTFPVKVVVTKDSQFVFCSGIGSPNYIMRYSLAPNGQLAILGDPMIIAGGSVQGLAIHPNDRVLYASTALSNVVHWYSISEAGLLTFGGQAASGGNSCVEMAVHPDGTWLYVCNVVSDTLTLMRINPDGSLQPAQFSYTIGSDIRSVETDGRYVYVTDESSIGSSPVGIVVFRINQDGSLTRLDTHVTGGGRPQQMAVWDPSVFAVPNSLNVTRGIVVSGGLKEILSSNDERLVVRPGLVLSSAEAPVQIQVEALVQLTPSIGTLRVRVEGHASVQNVRQRIELYDWIGEEWVEVDSRIAATSDQIVDVWIDENPSRFLAPATNRVLTRVFFRATGPVLSFPWQARVDHVMWSVTP